MQININASKIVSVPSPLLVIFFNDHHIIIPRSIRYKILKNMILEEIQNEKSELWNYYPREYLTNLDRFCELELEHILFSIRETDLLPEFKKRFWQEVISNQYMMNVSDKFFSELALLASPEADKGMSFGDYYQNLNAIIHDGNGLFDGIPFQNLIKRIKEVFTYYQVIRFIVKYQFAKEENVYNYVLANQIMKTIEQTDYEYSLKKSVLFTVKTSFLEEIASSMKIDLGEESRHLYAREYLVKCLEQKDETPVTTALSDEDIVRVVGKFIPLGEQVQAEIQNDEKLRYNLEFKQHLESEALLMSSMINYNKNTNQALDMLNHQLDELTRKNEELTDKLEMLSKATGVAFSRHYRLKRWGKIALKAALGFILIFVCVFVFWYLYTHNFSTAINDFFNKITNLFS